MEKDQTDDSVVLWDQTTNKLNKPASQAARKPFKQAEPKMCHSPKVEDGVEN